MTKIITGSLKGRVIALPATEAARPTRNRILQAAFNILQGYAEFDGAVVLDICCGSGSWGLEALSRGAKHATFIDTDTATVQANIKALGVANQSTIIKADATTFKPQKKADIILTDPPYTATVLLQKLLANAAVLGKPGSLWLIETASPNLSTPEALWPNYFTLLQSKMYGASAVYLLQYEGAQDE